MESTLKKNRNPLVYTVIFNWYGLFAKQKYEVHSKAWKKNGEVYAHFKCCAVLVWTFRNIASQEYHKYYPRLHLESGNSAELQ